MESSFEILEGLGIQVSRRSVGADHNEWLLEENWGSSFSGVHVSTITHLVKSGGLEESIRELVDTDYLG